MSNWQPVFGVFYMPLIDEFYMGYPGSATLNGEPIHVDESQHIDGQSFLCVTAETHRAFEIHYEGKSRSLGSTAAHICFAARGTAVAALLGKVSLWDVAGALPVVQAAGGDMRYLQNHADSLDLRSVADGSKFTRSLLAGPAWALDYFSDRILERQADQVH
jgi:myo-inositol-1(or 4)-monophosphatase